MGSEPPFWWEMFVLSIFVNINETAIFSIQHTLILIQDKLEVIVVQCIINNPSHLA